LIAAKRRWEGVIMSDLSEIRGFSGFIELILAKLGLHPSVSLSMIDVAQPVVEIGTPCFFV
jgi:hypothetical protein